MKIALNWKRDTFFNNLKYTGQDYIIQVNWLGNVNNISREKVEILLWLEYRGVYVILNWKKNNFVHNQLWGNKQEIEGQVW